MRVACVLRSGGIYTPEHVARLRDGVARHLPGAEFVCLSDVDVDCERIPLLFGWPGWWSKMELFRPDIAGDILFFDLDTVICGDLSEIAAVGRLAIMRDVYRLKGLQSSMMFLPEAERGPVWDTWRRNPQGWMRVHSRGGDQEFLERFWLRKAVRWQDRVPGQVVSFKAHCRQGVPSGARVVVFHGSPRPWEVNWLEAA